MTVQFSKITAIVLVLGIVGGLIFFGSIFLRQSDQAALSPTPESLDASRVVATVNEINISEQTWQREVALDKAMSLLAEQPQPSAEQVLDRLINAQLVLSAARTQRPDLKFDLEQAEQRLNALLANWGKSETDLAQSLLTTKITRPDLLAELQNLLLIEAYLSQLDQSTSSALWLQNQRKVARVSIFTDLDVSGRGELTTNTSERIPTVEATPLAQVVPTRAPVLEDQNTGSAEGQQAPDFELLDLSGQHVRLSSFRGQPVVINFWATWCPACQKEFPSVRASYARYASQGVVLLGVDLREPIELVSQFAQTQNLIYPILLDSDGSVSAQYAVFGIPTTVVIDAQGRVASRLTGPLTEEKFAEMVEPLLSQTGAGVQPISLPTPPVVTPLAAARDFTLPDQDGKSLNLKEYLSDGKETAILVFYRGQT